MMAQSDDLYKELFRWDQKFSVLSFHRQESPGLKQLTEATGGRYCLVEKGFSGLRNTVAELVTKWCPLMPELCRGARWCLLGGSESPVPGIIGICF